MKAPVTASELFKRGLIDKAQAEKVQRYLEARERFLGIFGSGPGLEGNLHDLQETAEKFRCLSGRIMEDWMHHVAFLKKTVSNELTTLFGEDIGKDKSLKDTLDLIESQCSYLSDALNSTCNEKVIDIIHKCIATERKINNIMNDYSKRIQGHQF